MRSRMNNDLFLLHVPNLYERSYLGQTGFDPFRRTEIIPHVMRHLQSTSLNVMDLGKKRFIVLFVWGFFWLSKCQHLCQISTHVITSHFNGDENKKTFCKPMAK